MESLNRILKRIHKIAEITHKYLLIHKYLFTFIVFVIFGITMGNKIIKIIKEIFLFLKEIILFLLILLLFYYFLTHGGN